LEKGSLWPYYAPIIYELAMKRLIKHVFRTIALPSPLSSRPWSRPGLVLASITLFFGAAAERKVRIMAEQQAANR